MTTSVDNERNRIDHQPDGVETDFVYDFQVNDASLMVPYADGILYVEPFTMTGLGDPLGGLVQFDEPPLGSVEELTLMREMPLTQETIYPPFGPFPPKSHENALDKLTWIAQQLQETIDRCWKSPIDGGGGDFYMPDPEYGKTLMWNEAENGLENGPSEGDFRTWLEEAEAWAVVAEGWSNTALGHSNQSEVWSEFSQQYSNEAAMWNNFSNNWSSFPEDVLVVDGVNPPGYSAYHWAQKSSEGGLLDIFSGDPLMMGITTPEERIRLITPLHGTPLGMVKLDQSNLVPLEHIPFEGALRLLGPYEGHDRCPKQPIGDIPESPCAEPDYRNPYERWPSMASEWRNGDYFIVLNCDEEPLENHILLTNPGDPVPIVIEVQNGDGIIWVDGSQGIADPGWYHYKNLALRTTMAQNVVFDDTNTTIKGENVQVWNTNLDALAAIELIRRDGSVKMINDFDLGNGFGVRARNFLDDAYFDMLRLTAANTLVVGGLNPLLHLFANGAIKIQISDTFIQAYVPVILPGAPTVDTHATTKAYVDTAVAAGGVPIGGIIMWSGTLATIPAGYALCDGVVAGTPNLLNQFVIQVATGATNPGATGGSATITAANMPIHTHVATVGTLATGSDTQEHTHRLHASVNPRVYNIVGDTMYWSGGPASPLDITTTTGRSNVHTHPVTGIPGIGNAGSGTAYWQPFYALAYIQRIS